jgi:hypothetical protein
MGWGYYQIRPSLARLDRVYRAVGSWIQANSKPDERLFVWGSSPEVAFYANRPMGTRFAFTNYHAGKIWGCPLDEKDAVGTEAHIVGRAWIELMEDLHRRPPDLIVDGGAGKIDGFDLHPVSRYPELDEFVRTHYVVAATVEGVPVFRLVR